MPVEEKSQPTTLEAAIDDICLANTVPSGVKRDLTSLMIELISWEATCQLNPSVRLSGNPTREHERAQCPILN